MTPADGDVQARSRAIETTCLTPACAVSRNSRTLLSQTKTLHILTSSSPARWRDCPLHLRIAPSCETGAAAGKAQQPSP